MKELQKRWAKLDKDDRRDWFNAISTSTLFLMILGFLFWGIVSGALPIPP